MKIVHKDIKPENVLLNDRKRAHISDFGLAETRKSSAASSVRVGPGGTLGYTAPELLVHGGGGNKSVDVYVVP